MHENSLLINVQILKVMISVIAATHSSKSQTPLPACIQERNSCGGEGEVVHVIRGRMGTRQRARRKSVKFIQWISAVSC